MTYKVLHGHPATVNGELPRAALRAEGSSYLAYDDLSGASWVGIMKAGRLIDLVDSRMIAAEALDRLYAEHMHG